MMMALLVNSFIQEEAKAFSTITVNKNEPDGIFNIITDSQLHILSPT